MYTMHTGGSAGDFYAPPSNYYVGCEPGPVWHTDVEEDAHDKMVAGHERFVRLERLANELVKALIKGPVIMLELKETLNTPRSMLESAVYSIDRGAFSIPPLSVALHKDKQETFQLTETGKQFAMGLL